MELVALINELAIVKGEEKYSELKLLLNKLVKEYVTRARNRVKKKENESF
jgi:hypothetical protein